MSKEWMVRRETSPNACSAPEAHPTTDDSINRSRARDSGRPAQQPSRLPALSGYESSEAPRGTSPDEQLTWLVSLFERTRTPIDVSFRDLFRAPPASERLTHSVHSYPARLLLNIPSFFLSTALSKKADTVLDPFCGSGTVLVEAIRLQRNAIGADSNPMARLISRVKLTAIDERKLHAQKASFFRRIPRVPSGTYPKVVNLDYWFYPHVQRDLLRLLEPIRRIRSDEMRELFLVAFSSCLREVSLADPRLSVPVRLKKNQYVAGHWLRQRTNKRLSKLKRVDVVDVFRRRLDAIVASVAKLGTVGRLGQLLGIYGDARRLNDVKADTIDLAITSPPYLGAQKYIRASSLSLTWLGLCEARGLRRLEDQNIGREHYAKIAYEQPVVGILPAAERLLQGIRDADPLRAHIAAQYLLEMRDALGELARVLKPDAHAVLVAGASQVRGVLFPTPQFLVDLASDFDLELRLHLIDTIRSRALMTKRNATAGRIDTESILLLRKRKAANGRIAATQDPRSKRIDVGRAS